MVTPEGLQVIEFNCRFGDPETQVVLPLIDGSLLDVLANVAEGGSVAGARLGCREGAAVTTVIAAEGYPGEYAKGRPVRIPPELARDEGVVLFHAGTELRNGQIVATGGRVIAATGVGDSLADAAERSRRAAEAIELEGKHFRRDIGWRELARV
jgi:phosphoribosylamine-glycine ligase